VLEAISTIVFDISSRDCVVDMVAVLSCALENAMVSAEAATSLIIP